jgi:hypothetical protein
MKLSPMKLALLFFLFICTANVFSQGDLEEFKFGETPIQESELIHTPPPKPEWLQIGAPIALLSFFFLLVFIVFKMIP